MCGDGSPIPSLTIVTYGYAAGECVVALKAMKTRELPSTLAKDACQPPSLFSTSSARLRNGCGHLRSVQASQSDSSADAACVVVSGGRPGASCACIKRAVNEGLVCFRM